jgi:hypothetical protein
VDHVAAAAEEKVEESVVNVPTEMMYAGSDQPDPILPFSHPEFSPEQYKYPDSDIPAVVLPEETGSTYQPESFPTEQ